VMKEYKGEYILAVEGNAPTNDGGVYCTVGVESWDDEGAKKGWWPRR